MITDATPMTMIDILSRIRAMPPTAKSQPKVIETTIQRMSEKRLYVKTSNRPIRSRAKEMASMLSFLICVALVTAINGAPTAETETSGCSVPSLFMASSTSSATLEFIPDSLVPYGEVKKASPWPSFVNMQSSTMS